MQRRNLETVKWLIYKENIEINTRKRNDTPIHIASKNWHLPIVQYLIEKQNIEVDIKEYEERTPLYCAFEKQLVIFQLFNISFLKVQI